MESEKRLYHILMGELWSIFSEYFGENLLYLDIPLYHAFSLNLFH